MKKKLACIALAACCALTVCGCGGENGGNKPEHLGLYVAEDGTMMKDGKPYYGVGVNYYSLINGCRVSPRKYDLTKALASLETLASYDVRVIRFNLGFYSSKEWFDFVQFNLETPHLEALDKIVEKCEQLGIGLIPSFAWNPAAISDAFNEPCNKAFARDDSNTMIWFLGFTKTVVSRYADSPAIFAWEYGNEQNLSSSIISRYRPELSAPPQYFGDDSRKKRTDDDYMTYETHQKVLELFAQAVHDADPYHRLIGSGDAAQRPYIWHWAREQEGRDSLEQFEEMFDMTVPGYMTAYSVHEYAHSDSGTAGKAGAALDGNHTFESVDFVDYFTKYLQQGARTKKAVYMGETGYLAMLPESRDWNGTDEAHSILVTEAILEAAYETDFPLTLLWTYDDRTLYNAQNHTSYAGGTEHSWNETFVKGKAYLEAIKEVNRKMDEKHTAAQETE